MTVVLVTGGSSRIGLATVRRLQSSPDELVRLLRRFVAGLAPTS